MEVLSAAVVLYRSPNFRGSKPLVLRGTGKLRSMQDLKAVGFGDKARSCRITDLPSQDKLSRSIVV